MQSLVREIVFYIIYTNTPFFISLRDLDSLNCYYNNFINEVVTPISIIILYYLLKLYQEVSLEVVKYIKGKINLLKTTPVSIY